MGHQRHFAIVVWEFGCPPAPDPFDHDPLDHVVRHRTGDFNGDGNTDILWRDASGNTSIWFMNGRTVSSAGNAGNIPTNWTVQSVNAE